MRIKHLVTSNQGGAFISAKELHLELLKQGQDSKLITRGRNSAKNRVPGLFNIELTRSKQIASTSITAAQSIFVQKNAELITTFGITTFPAGDLEVDTDILHVHSIYNLISTNTLGNLTRVGIPIILQLHDQRFLTGGCHHDLGCREYEKTCSGCPQVRKKFQRYVKSEKTKIKFLSNLDNVQVVAPSKFLFDKAAKVVSSDKLHLIPNVPPQTYINSRVTRGDLRDSIGIKSTDFVIGFCAANIDSPYKNFEYFQTLIKYLKNVWTNRLPNLKVLLIGKGGQEFTDESLIRFESGDEIEVRSYLGAMDLLLVPSKIDNVPNVVIEALLEGTPVLATRVGGIPDLMAHLKKDFFLVGDPDFDASRIVQQIGVNDREYIGNQSRLRFDRDKIINDYLRLYRSALSRGIS